MKLSKIVFVFFFFSLTAFAQDAKLTMVLLGNDDISIVNVDKDKFITGLKPLTDLFENQFKGIPETQKIGLEVIFHKQGEPTFLLYSVPEIDNGKKEVFLNKAKRLKLGTTKLVDFPILMSFNSGSNFEKDFGVKLLVEQRKDDFTKADFKRKYSLLKDWAAQEVLPVLAAYAAQTEAKFAGGHGFGTEISKLDFAKNQDVYKRTSTNSDYWRAVMEMERANQLIVATKIFMLVSQGQLDHALRYAEIASFFSDPKSNAALYLKEFTWKMAAFNVELEAMANKGIIEHDAGNYKKAFDIYTAILNDYPYSGWIQYERYFSQNALDVKNGSIKMEDRKNWDIAKRGIFSSNPMYYMDVRAGNAEEAYRLFRRQEINTLFKNNRNIIEDVYEYANIAIDLEVYDFAAQLYWFSSCFNKDKQTEALHKFLYCLEKLGVKDLKSNFEGDFKKIFADIEKEKDKAMKENGFYKSFEK